MRYVLLFLLSITLAPTASAQIWDDEVGEFRVDWGGYFWGVRGGLSLANQDWNSLETEIAALYHADLFLESIPASGKFSFYGQLGYHQRGSRTARRFFNVIGGDRVQSPSDKFIFHNVSLGVGAKQIVARTSLADLYYRLGVRAEYTFDTNLEDYEDPFGSGGVNFRFDYPVENYEFVNRFTYGASFGAGANVTLGERVGAFIELNLHPDLGFQYDQGSIDNVIDPSRPGNTITVGARQIRNFTIEISAGLRFLRKWRYVD